MKLSDFTDSSAFSDVTVLLSLTMFLHQVDDRILRRNFENLEKKALKFSNILGKFTANQNSGQWQNA